MVESLFFYLNGHGGRLGCHFQYVVANLTASVGGHFTCHFSSICSAVSESKLFIGFTICGYGSRSRKLERSISKDVSYTI